MTAHQSFHVANVTSANLRPIIVKHAERKSHLMTDGSTVYPRLATNSPGIAPLSTLAEEYVKVGGFMHTNTVESHFALLKRGCWHVPPRQRGASPRYLADRFPRQHARSHR